MRATKLLRQKSELEEILKTLKDSARISEEASVGSSERNLAEACSRLRSVATSVFEKAVDRLNAMEVDAFSKDSAVASSADGVSLNELVKQIMSLGERIQQKAASVYEKLDSRDLVSFVRNSQAFCLP